MTTLQPIRAQRIFGPLGNAMDASLENRLKKFIVDADSEPLKLFTQEQRENSGSGDWYGEHVGKWLIAASQALIRTNDLELRQNLERALATLSAFQEPSGYLGTYALEAPCRFTSPIASSIRTWDIWIHAWMILGLIEVGKALNEPEAIAMACRIADLILSCVTPESLSKLGNHNGLSSLIIIEPFACLSTETKDPRYAEFAKSALEIADTEGLNFLSFDPKTDDASTIGTGKIYQILWCLIGIVELANYFGNPRWIEQVEKIFANIAEFHLTPQGGPWGGIATHKEVFNPKGFFDPCGLVETCSSATWIKLCRKLYEHTGKEKYLDHAETTLHNSILGAVSSDATNWIYFSFPNGRRNDTYYWACCKSSGAMALEEAALLMMHRNDDGIAIHGIAPFLATDGQLQVSLAGEPSDKSWDLEVRGHSGKVRLRKPGWATLKVPTEAEAEYDLKSESWVFDCGTELIASIQFEIAIQVKTHMHTVEHHGQEIVRTDFATVSWGPYSFAFGLIEGVRKVETLLLPRLNPESIFSMTGKTPLQIDLRIPGRKPIPMFPYYLAGGQGDGNWRASWIQVAWQ